MQTWSAELLSEEGTGTAEISLGGVLSLSISKVKRDAEKNEYRSYMGKKNSSLSQNLSEQLESLEK